MVQSAATVHFDKADPIVFYYEPFQYNYEEDKNTAGRFNLETLNREAGRGECIDEDIFTDSSTELENRSPGGPSEPGAAKQPDSTLTRGGDADVDIELDTPLTPGCHGDRSGGNGGALDSAGPDLALGASKPGLKGEPATEDGADQPRVTNATYFYRILHHLIDVSCDGSRFRCCARVAARACDSCRVIERLLLTYLDLTTLEDIIADRARRGICGHLYCVNPATKSKSKYKIDVISRNVYKREEYESFCSVLCLEENEKVYRAVAASPVETGAFTPRAMRCADNATLRTLHDNLFSLPQCSARSRHAEGSNAARAYLKLDASQQRQLGVVQPAPWHAEAERDSSSELKPPQPESKRPERAPEGAPARGENRRGRVDTFEIYEDFESCDSRSDSSLSEANVTFDRDTRCPGSIYKAPEGLNGACAGPDSMPGALTLDEREYLGVFSLLWYLLSNLVTDDTRDLVNSGVLHPRDIEDQFRPLLECCLRDVPAPLAPSVRTHVQHLLSTFRPIKNDLNDKVLEPLSLVVKYVVLVNRHRLPLVGSPMLSEDPLPEDLVRLAIHYDEPFEEPPQADFQLLVDRVEDELARRFQLDQESIDILLELFVHV